jgi:inner membrane protein
MDSISQIALGAAVSVAVMGRRTALWKSAAWGAVAGTLPDLDVFIDHGDAIANMVLHRAETHALFWLTLFSVPLAALVARLHGEWAVWQRWWLAVWLALITHPLLDAMTVYGTQLALPWSNHPFAVGSVFIIDPLYTLPLVAGTGITLATTRLRANTLGLVLSTAYLAWGFGAQQHVGRVARDALTRQGIAAERVLVTPSAFNTIAWRVVVMQRDHYLEGFYSLLDKERTIAFDRFERGAALEADVSGFHGYQRIRDFSRGFYALRQQGPRVLITDLRMGQEPAYTFSFAIAERASAATALPVPEQVSTRPDLGRVMPWLWRRIGGDPSPPPR